MGKKFAVHLPEEILTNILLRLKVRSLLCCKSVCKTWLSIISDLNFVNSHLQRAIIASRISPRLLFIQIPDEEPRTVSGVIRSYDDFDRLVLPPIFKFTRVIGTCCNGIICLSNIQGNVLYLWNPSIRQYKKLLPPTRGTFGSRIGFGYDSVTNDYKVVRIVYENSWDDLPKVWVYSTNASSWREFQDPILKIFGGFKQTDVVVSGVLYLYDGEKLISFDLHKEVFGLVPLPSFIQPKCSDVMDFEGSVSMVFEFGPDFDLWTLDDVSGQMSWTKKFRIDTDPQMDIWLYCYLGAGKFYGSDSLSGNYFLFDYEKKETKFYGLHEPNPLATLKYTETLVSLEGFEQLESNAN